MSEACLLHAATSPFPRVLHMIDPLMSDNREHLSEGRDEYLEHKFALCVHLTIL